MSKLPYRACVPLPNMPIALVGTVVGGKCDFIPVGFVSGVNISPPVMCVSISRKNATALAIEKNGAFGLSFPPSSRVVEVDYCGLVSGRDADKSGVFTPFFGDDGNAPMIEECAISCECKYLDKREFGSDIAYFGEVTRVYVDERAVRADGKLDVSVIDPLSFSGIELLYRRAGDAIGRGWDAGKAYEDYPRAGR